MGHWFLHIWPPNISYNFAPSLRPIASQKNKMHQNNLVELRQRVRRRTWCPGVVTMKAAALAVVSRWLKAAPAVVALSIARFPAISIFHLLGSGGHRRRRVGCQLHQRFPKKIFFFRYVKWLWKKQLIISWRLWVLLHETQSINKDWLKQISYERNQIINCVLLKGCERADIETVPHEIATHFTFELISLIHSFKMHYVKIHCLRLFI